MLLYEFHPLAERELVNAVEHYEALAPGKGLELAEQVQVAIQRICEFPDSALLTRRAIRSLVVQPSTRWHFTIHYTVIPAHIRVLALAHQARQPFYWLGRR